MGPLMRLHLFIKVRNTSFFVPCCNPRLRQGVNAALEDVLVLERALESCGDRLGDALPEYERSRAADSKALVRVSRGGWRVELRYFVH